MAVRLTQGLRRFAPAAWMAALLLLVCVTRLLLPSVTQTLYVHDGAQEPIILPHTVVMPGRPPDETVHYRVLLRWQPYQLSSFYLLANSCIRSLTVNDHPVRIGECKPQAVRLKEFLHPGDNLVDVGVFKIVTSWQPEFYGTYLFDFYLLPWSQKTGRLLMQAWIATLVTASCLLLRRLAFDRVTIAAFAWFILAACWEMTECNYTQLTFDLIGHLDYINYMHTHWWREDPFIHNIFRHPPLYYWLASAVLKAFGPPLALGALPLRVFSLLLYLAFMVVSLITIRKLAAAPWMNRMASLAFIFWPVSLFYAPRISNDIPFYTASAAAAYFLVTWAQERRPRAFWLAVMAAALGTMIKFSGLLLLGSIGLLFLSRWRDWQSLLRGQRNYAGLGLMLVVLSLATGPLYSAYKSHQSQRDTGIYGDMVFSGGFLHADLSPRHALTFTIADYLTSPFIYTGTHETRQNFWEYVFKTSVFDEWAWGLRPVARLILALLLANALCMLAALVLMDAPTRRNLTCEAALIVVPLIGIIAFRYSYAQTGAQDFRYILPIIMPMSVCWAKCDAFWRARGFNLLRRMQLICGAGVIGLGHLYVWLHFVGLLHHDLS